MWSARFIYRKLSTRHRLCEMSSATPEIAEEALESQLDSMTISEEQPSDSAASKEISEEKASDSAAAEDEHKPRRKHRGKYRTEADRLTAWEEAQKDKVTVATGLKGTVKWYSILGRYGFIERADGEGDIFVHQSGISVSKEKGCLRTLAEDEDVEFDVVKGKKGEEAVNVCGPDGSEVQGAKAFRILMRHPRNFRKEKGEVKERKANPKSEEKENAEAEGDHVDKPKKTHRRPYRRFGKKPAKGNGETSEDAPEERKKETRGRRRRANSGTPKATESTGAEGDAPATSLDAMLA